jgi:hypothetical protein
VSNETGGVIATGTAGAVRWLTIHDELLRGLVHTISNRLATITAASGVLEVGLVPDEPFLDGMRMDAERLQQLLHTLRTLPRRTRHGLEPMLLTDALDGARHLVEEHHVMRGVTVRATSIGEVMPVRAEPTSVLHAAAVAMLAGARAAGVGTGAHVAVTLETVGDDVVCRVRGDDAGERLAGDDAAQAAEAALLREDASAIDWLLAESHGRAEIHSDGLAFVLPTLQASRRRAS